jgi:hypothetical protein
VVAVLSPPGGVAAATASATRRRSCVAVALIGSVARPGGFVWRRDHQFSAGFLIRAPAFFAIGIGQSSKREA